jgi:hypothetical protein
LCNDIDDDTELDADIKAYYAVAHLSTLADVRQHFRSWRPTKEQRKVISAGGRGTYLRAATPASATPTAADGGGADSDISEDEDDEDEQVGAGALEDSQ